MLHAALAERAWHRAFWEKTGNVYDMKRDWIEFANTLGYRELPRMENVVLCQFSNFSAISW
jgi:hypothetical protein